MGAIVNRSGVSDGAVAKAGTRPETPDLADTKNQVSSRTSGDGHPRGAVGDQPGSAARCDTVPSRKRRRGGRQSAVRPQSRYAAGSNPAEFTAARPTAQRVFEPRT